MKTNIQIFTSDIFGEIRTCQVNNQIMFVGKDVATALGYAKPQNALATHVDREDKSTAPIQGTASNAEAWNHRGQVHDSVQNHGTSPHGSKALDAAYSIAFPNSTPINVNKKKRITQQ